MGGKKTELLQFQTEEGRKFELPVALVIGDAEGPDAVVTAGIHGGEFCGVLAAVKLFRELSPSDVKGSVKIITVCDTSAFESRRVSLSPLGGDNLNRNFPGRTKGDHRDMLAAKIFDEIKGADYHMDLHCGEVLERSAPFAIYHRGRKGDLNDRSHEMAYYYGLPNIMITETDGRWSDKGTCYASVYENIGIPSVLFQTGGLGIASADNVNTHTEGIKNVMRRFGSLRGSVQPVGRPQIFENMELVCTKGSGIHYRRVNVGDADKRGQMIGMLTDYFGTPTEKILSPIDGKVLFISESSAMSERDFVAAIGVGR